MAKILVVEDDKELATLLVDAFRAEHHTVDSVLSGGDALEYLRASEYDLVVLDVSLPEVDGLEICQRMRSQRRNTPILMVTGRSSTADKLSGFDSGADDYVTKPFDMNELSARVRALLRRAAQQPTNELVVRDVSLDPIKHRVTLKGKDVGLLPIEFAVLEFLMRHPDQVFSHEALLTRVWPTDKESTPEAVRSCIKRLRKKMNDDGDPGIIETVYAVGYRFNSK